MSDDSALIEARSPAAVLDAVRRVGRIELDPFTTSDNPTRARAYLTREHNAFARDWSTLAPTGLVYAFPPADRRLARTVRFVESQARRGLEVLLLVPARTDTAYAQTALSSASAVCLWRTPLDLACTRTTHRREQLDLFDESEPSLGWNSPPGTFPALLAYWGRRHGRFREAFGPHGTVLSSAR